MISSVIPSLKYSSSLLALRLVKGSTATVGELGSTAVGGGRNTLTIRARYATAVAMAMTTTDTAAPMIIRRPRTAFAGEEGSRGVISRSEPLLEAGSTALRRGPIGSAAVAISAASSKCHSTGKRGSG